MSNTILNVPVYAISSRCPLLIVDNQLEFSSRVPLDEKPRPGDIKYQTGPNERLPLIAFRFYRDVRLWWVIYDANASKLLGHPLEVPAGINLTIPSRQAIEQELLNDRSI